MRTRVACDIDGVLCDTLEGAREEIAETTGIPIGEIVDTGIYFAPFTHANARDAAALATPHAFWCRPTLLARCRPLPGAAAAMARLADAGMLAGYVTRRSEASVALTRDWFRRHGFPTAPTRHVGHEDADRNQASCKSDACIELGATHLVDDSQDEIGRAIAAGLAGVLVDHPLGRVARAEWLAARPEALVARDVSHAVSMLTGG